MINIIIADDHKIILDGLLSLIAPHKEIRVVGQASNGVEVLQLLQENQVDVVILDIGMPEMNGVEATKHIRKNYPNVKILVLTMHGTIGFIRKIAETGAHGYILKNKGKEELIAAIHKVYEGGKYFGEEVTKILFASLTSDTMAGEIKLTKREIEVLKLIVDGKITKEISDILTIGVATVSTHRKNLLSKIGVQNTAGLVRFAIENGYTT